MEMLGQTGGQHNAIIRSVKIITEPKGLQVSFKFTGVSVYSLLGQVLVSMQHTVSKYDSANYMQRIYLEALLREKPVKDISSPSPKVRRAQTVGVGKSQIRACQRRKTWIKQLAFILAPSVGSTYSEEKIK